MTLTPFWWKLIAGAIGAMLLGVLIASWMARGREIERLADWQRTVIDTTTLATVEPDAKGKRRMLTAAQVPGAISALKRSADNAESTLNSISTAALKEKALQDKLDTGLNAILEDQARRAEGSAATLRDLLARKSTGNKDQDCAIMEKDSEAAWSGWRN